MSVIFNADSLAQARDRLSGDDRARRSPQRLRQELDRLRQHAVSPFLGSCYTQFDDFGHGNTLKMYFSRDGGVTWTAGRSRAPA